MHTLQLQRRKDRVTPEAKAKLKKTIKRTGQWALGIGLFGAAFLTFDFFDSQHEKSESVPAQPKVTHIKRERGVYYKKLPDGFSFVTVVFDKDGKSCQVLSDGRYPKSFYLFNGDGELKEVYQEQRGQ